MNNVWCSSISFSRDSSWRSTWSVGHLNKMSEIDLSIRRHFPCSNINPAGSMTTSKNKFVTSIASKHSEAKHFKWQLCAFLSWDEENLVLSGRRWRSFPNSFPTVFRFPQLPGTVLWWVGLDRSRKSDQCRISWLLAFESGTPLESFSGGFCSSPS